jgi:hypothetical protein
VIWLTSAERGTYSAASAVEQAAGDGESLDYGLQQAEEASGRP